MMFTFTVKVSLFVNRNVQKKTVKYEDAECRLVLFYLWVSCFCQFARCSFPPNAQRTNVKRAVRIQITLRLNVSQNIPFLLVVLPICCL